MNGTLAMMTFYLRKRETIEDVPIEDQVAFAPMKSTLPVAMALDPRSDAQVEDESGDSSYTV